ncbi:MAG: DMT family transporter [Bacillota bacterium]
MRLAQILGFLFLPFAWGSGFVFIKLGLVFWSPFMLVGVRHLVAGLFLALVAVALRRSWPRTWAALWPPLLFGVTFGGSMGLVNWAELYIPSGQASVLMATAPFWITVLSRFWLKEQIPVSRFLALGIGLVGVILAVSDRSGVNPAVPELLRWLGLGATFLASWGYSVSFIISKRYFTGDVFANSSIQLLTGGVGLLLVALLTEGSLQVPALTLASVSPLLYLALVPSAGAMVVQVLLLKRMPASQVGYAPLLIPISAFLLGVLLLSEPVTLTLMGGTALVLGGAWLANAPAPRKSAQPEPLPKPAPVVLKLPGRA